MQEEIFKTMMSRIRRDENIAGKGETRNANIEFGWGHRFESDNFEDRKEIAGNLKKGAVVICQETCAKAI